MKTDTLDVERAGNAGGGVDLGGGGLNTCMGRITVCTTSGLSLTLLVARGVAATSARRVMLANDAENGQPTGEQRAKDDELAALGFEKIEKVAWFHGWPLGERMGCTGALVVVTTGGGGGGGDSRFTSTVN